MIRSKLLFNFLKLCFLVVVTGNIISCVKAQRQNTAGGTSNPRVFSFSRDGRNIVDLTGYASDQIASQNISYDRVAFTGVISEDANYGDKREYNFSMCGLNDVRAPGNPLLGQKFEIFSELPVFVKEKYGMGQRDQRDYGKGNIAIVQSNNCLYWTVNFQFDPFASSVNLYVNFIFRAVSGARTYIHHTVLINPWDQQRGSNPEFFDFTYHGLSQATQQMSMAIGPEQIYQALNGKFKEGNRQLEIGSVQFVPVKKDVFKKESLAPQVVYTLPSGRQEAIQNVSGSSIGDLTSEAFKSIHDLRTAALGESPNPELLNLQTIDLNLNIRLSDLKVRLKDSAGVVVGGDVPLPTGRYKIQAQLVASDLEENGKYYIISSRIPNNGSDVPGEGIAMNAPAGTTWNTQTMGVNAVIPLTLVARPMWGNLQIVLKVEPISMALKPFEAVYYLGTFESIGHGASPIFDLGNFNLNRQGQLTFSFDEYLKNATNYDSWVKGRPEEGINSDSVERGFRRFRFTHLDVLFSRIVPGDTSTDRTIQYTVKTCLQETAMGVRPQAGRKFDITTDDRGIPITFNDVKTDDQGCLSWVGLISHKFYQRERLIQKSSTLTYKNENGQSQSQTLKYYINPWDEKFTFGRDARVLPADYIKQINEGQKFAPPTRILVTDFHYDAIGFRYVVDKFMNLTVKKTVLLNVKPKVLKYNSIVWGRSGFSDLRDGIYLLKVAMQKDYLDPAAPGRRIKVDSQGKYTIPYNTQDTKTRRVFITIKEVLVRVLGGAIVTPIEFDINDLRTLRLRSQMFIQIETIDEMLLRAVMRVDNGLTQRMNSAIQLTVNIRDRQMTDDQLAAEIKRLTEQARAVADQQEIQDKITQLERERSVNYEQLRKLMSSVDYTVAQQLFADIERLGRDGGQTEESALGNIRRKALDRVLEKVTAAYNKQTDYKDYVQTTEVRESYANKRREECRILRNRLIAEGDHKTAERYSPEAAHTLCPLDIPPDQMFYYLSTREDLGSENWLREVLSPEDFTLLKNSLFPGHSGNLNNEIINVLRDDFTEAYRPDYDFNLLSNQGDEMAEGNNPEFVSGLARRTFMGPVTFVLNGNGSAVRPTDVLDEASCGRTCEQLAEIELDQVVASDTVQSTLDVIRNYGSDVNAAYEKNPYFGYVGQFYKKQVNDLIPMYRGVNRIYREEMDAFSKDGYFVDSMRLTHVRLTNPDPESLKTMDPVCYGEWKSGIEKLYEQWRDLSETNHVTIQIPNIPDNCFRQTSNILAANQFLDKVNGQVLFPRRESARGDKQLDPNYFIQPTDDYDYAGNPVTPAELKEFSKNGVRSVKLPLESKEKILHHLCYITRETMAPQGPAMVRQIFTNSLDQQKSADDRKATGEAFAEFLKGRFDMMEKECHKAVSSYVNSIRSAGRMTPKNQAILMSDLSKYLPFIVERRVRVLDTTHRYIYQDGKTLNYSVGKSFGIDGGFRTSRGRKFEFDADKIAGMTSGAAAGAAAGALATAWTGPGSALGAVAGAAIGGAIGAFSSGVIGSAGGFLGWNMEWQDGEGLSTSNGTSVSSGTTLAAQISTLDIELARFEKCIVIRPTAQFLVDTKKTIDEENDWVDGDKSDNFASYQFIRDLKNVGYFVCSGDIQTEDDLNVGTPLRVRERYYYFTQIFNDGDMQDPGELVNHPWMLMLRGERDYAMFEQALMIPETQLVWGEARKQMWNDVGDFLAGSSTSNNRVSGAVLNGNPHFTGPGYNAPGDFEVVNKDDVGLALDMMQRGFERALPAVPGMYTFSDYESDSVIAWPADQSSARARIKNTQQQPAQGSGRRDGR